MTTDLWLWPVLLGVLGLVFGSFIATVAIRWPKGRSALQGRSECDACGKALGGIELVPWRASCSSADGAGGAARLSIRAIWLPNSPA